MTTFDFNLWLSREINHATTYLNEATSQSIDMLQPFSNHRFICERRFGIYGAVSGMHALRNSSCCLNSGVWRFTNGKVNISLDSYTGLMECESGGDIKYRLNVNDMIKVSEGEPGLGLLLHLTLSAVREFGHVKISDCSEFKCDRIYDTNKNFRAVERAITECLTKKPNMIFLPDERWSTGSRVLVLNGKTVIGFVGQSETDMLWYMSDPSDYDYVFSWFPYTDITALEWLLGIDKRWLDYISDAHTNLLRGYWFRREKYDYLVKKWCPWL